MRSLVVLLLLAGCRPFPGAKEHLEIETAGAKKADRLPLIIALHGYGSSPDNIVQLFEDFPIRARVIAPHGLFRVGGGWGWFPVTWERTSDEIAPGITQASDAVLRVIATQSQAQPTCGKAIVLGFSQGGFLSYAIAARAPEQIFAAFPLGGLLPAVMQPKDKRTAMPRVIAWHGDADNVVDVGYDRETHARFEAAGYPGELHVLAGVRHQVTPQIMGEVHAALAQAIRDEGCAN